MRIGKLLGLGVASIMVHGALFYSADKVLSWQSLISQQAGHTIPGQKDRLSFEFVEAPPVTPLLTPEHAKKISSHDAVNQDSSPNKTAASENGPAAAAVGKSDQLRQVRNEGGQEPRPEIAPKQAKQATKQTPPEDVKKIDRSPSENPAKDESPMTIPTPEKAGQAPQRPSAPQTAVQGLTGRDKISTPEMSRSKSPGAALFGITSFEATGSGMGAYMKNLKERIWLAWFPYLAFQYPQDFRGADAVISFTLNAEGEVKIVRVVDDGGNSTFASYCMQAVQKASGFGPVPKEILALMGKDDLELKFGFHYR